LLPNHGLRNCLTIIFEVGGQRASSLKMFVWHNRGRFDFEFVWNYEGT